MQDAGCKIQDAGCIPRVRVFRRQVPGTGFQVPGTWHLGPGTRYRINAEGRTPSTEPGPENAHTGLATFLVHFGKACRLQFPLDLVVGNGLSGTNVNLYLTYPRHHSRPRLLKI
jgi:hypothetical protein